MGPAPATGHTGRVLPIHAGGLAVTTPEQKARQSIDRQLAETGWLVQDYRAMNLSAGPGVAVREFPLTTGEADYLLYADGRVIGVIEAKPEGNTLTGVETRSAKCTERLWHVQIEAVRNLEESLAANRPRALIQTPTGED